MIDTFKNRGLEAGQGSAKWSRFFVLASSFIALIEDSPEVENTLTTAELFSELYELCRRLDVIAVRDGIRSGMRMLSGEALAAVYILILDANERSTKVKGFANDLAGIKTIQT